MTKVPAQPKINLQLSAFDKGLEWTGWLILLILWILVIRNYQTLPDSIPVHFNLSGKADNFEDKWTVFLMPLIGSILIAGMTFLNRFPHKFNYPGVITVDNAQRQYTNATRFIRYLKSVIALIFLSIVHTIIQTANGKSGGPELWFLPLAVALIFIPLIIFVVKSSFAKVQNKS